MPNWKDSPSVPECILCFQNACILLKINLCAFYAFSIVTCYLNVFYGNSCFFKKPNRNFTFKITSDVRFIGPTLSKGKAIPFTGLDRPWVFQEVEAPRFQDNQHMKVVRLSALHTDRLYPPRNIPGTHFCYRLSRPQGHSAAGRIMSMKNSSDTIGNRTRDLPACSAVP